MICRLLLGVMIFATLVGCGGSGSREMTRSSNPWETYDSMHHDMRNDRMRINSSHTRGYVDYYRVPR